MRERKCKSCNLTYKGLKERCPFCKKLTKIGVFNKIMCILGYLAFAFLIIIFAYSLMIKTVINAVWFMPSIATVLAILIIIGIVVLIFK